VSHDASSAGKNVVSVSIPSCLKNFLVMVGMAVCAHRPSNTSPVTGSDAPNHLAVMSSVHAPPSSWLLTWVWNSAEEKYLLYSM